MNQSWWDIAFSCVDCKTALPISLAAFSADGEFRFTFYCDKCKQTFNWRAFASKLQHIALMNDMEKEKKIIPAQPQKKVIIPPEKLTDKDKKFLSDFGINSEEEK